MYKLINDEFGNPEPVVKRSDGFFIPFDPDNKDYQAYLAWVAEGNQLLSAD